MPLFELIVIQERRVEAIYTIEAESPQDAIEGYWAGEADSGIENESEVLKTLDITQVRKAYYA
jgi:hypothetical protein